MYGDDEDPFEVAQREFKEETGRVAPTGDYFELGDIKQAGGKVVTAWAIEKDLGPVQVKSNTFTMEWPPRSGKQEEFPEVDRAEWFKLSVATKKLHPGQDEFVHRLAKQLSVKIRDISDSKPLDEKLSGEQISLL